MAESLKVLLAQLEPSSDPARNADVAATAIDDHPEAALAVFPELFLHGYSLEEIVPLENIERSDALSTVREAAGRNGTSVVLGAAVRTGAGMANAAVCIDEQGEVVACYEKVHPYGAERRFFEEGHEYLTCLLSGVVVAPLVCYDIDFPEAARAVALAGAELLVTISANMDPYFEEHALFLRSRALENGLPHVYVNRVGEEAGLVFCGGSGVADAEGRLLVEMPPYLADTRLVTVPLAKGTMAWRSDRRPDTPARRAESVATA